MTVRLIAIALALFVAAVAEASALRAWSFLVAEVEASALRPQAAEVSASALPTEIPLFPLPETSLFPGVSRPFLISSRAIAT